MKINDIPNLRLSNQQISTKNFSRAADLVSWMGAMQAQDYEMVKWAVGLRVNNFTKNDFDKAINSGEIFRTHLLRPTWHLVSAEDIYWMIQLTADKIRKAQAARDKMIGMDANIFSTSKKLLQNVLTGQSLTTDELREIFIKEKIDIEGNRLYHHLMHAELDCLICNGVSKKGKHTYALFNERVKFRQEYSREEALKKIAEKYFLSHSPATLHDFIWWSGLKIKEASQALESIKQTLITFTIQDRVFWSTNNLTPQKKSGIYLLPAYDEYIISYTDRTNVLPASIHKSAISSNGVFRSVIVENGTVIGLWKRAARKDRIVISTELFKNTSKDVLSKLKKCASEYGIFLNKTVEIE